MADVSRAAASASDAADHRSQLAQGLRVSIRAALASAMAVATALLLQLPFPIYAMIAAVIVTDSSSEKTKRLAAPRLVGTVIGASIGAALNPALPHGPLTLGIGVAVAMSVAYILRLQDAAKLSGYVCGIALVQQMSAPWSYAMYRLIETALGVGAAVLVSLVPPLVGKNPGSGIGGRS